MRWTLPGRRFVVGLFSLAGLGLGLAFAVDRVRSSPAASQTESPASRSTAPKDPVLRVALSEEKYKAAGLRVEPAQTNALPVEVVVPGQIQPNVDRQVEIRTRVSGVIRSVAVVLGQDVKAGDLLVTLDSADVATARLNLRSRQRELSTARTEAAWRSEVADNVETLIPALRKNVAAATLEKQFASKPLGNDRALLLAAYAEWEIARHEEKKQAELFRDHIVGEHPATLSKHTREGAQAKFEASLEQVRYDVVRLKRLADQQVRLAESAVIDAGERLRTLGVPVDLDDSVAHPEKVLNGLSGEPMTTYPIFAPFDGTITTRAAVPSQQAQPIDILMTLVDLSAVRVTANISEVDFAVLPTLRDGTIHVTAAAYPDRKFAAKILNVGTQVEPTTRTVTLLAETPNAEGLLKLGMFVRIALDSAKAERATTVPSGALTEVEGKPAVFLPDKDDRTFIVRPVTLGREVEGRQSIAFGLVPGDRVVTAGTFALKSELILMNESGEE